MPRTIKKPPIVPPGTIEENLKNTAERHSGLSTVQALASQGGEVALDDTLKFDIACSNPLMMSPSFCGSNPYPCGSLTYRTLFNFSLS
jgi:hypothetical protein